MTTTDQTTTPLRALVTGAGAGIGAASARSLARNGAKVLVTDINLEAAQRTADEITAAGGVAIAAALDASSNDDHVAAVALAEKEFGGLDIAINNAGLTIPSTPTADVTDAQWHKVIDVDLTGAFYGVRAQIPALQRAGGGTIITVSSIAGERALVGMSPYSAAKHAVVGLMQTVAWEYGKDGIRALSVAPGFIATGMEANLDDETAASLPGLHALNRLGRPEEVGDAIAWLAGPQASFISGSYIPVDGGLLAR
ncbi:SDR family NAD(P)-dependent oxidoreductase [Demequina zhanjiangensis]|uniref:SDR family NAD(P)-dependent oxidoreductase n=1 Tax=Demequina zhanjiangensis TaxID=3051659 RepID=A0ABT8G1J4_9MICO|nr:SDR family NAD(P)-dependent oxidoreductase [Demequina sp. SYSU T00b26]MDN4473008.1 SDR family NAD(P)-dependent oxidoreductase [Demequina sp. SYSU T00b26]